ncbi:hypothetical protein ALC56_05846 [Trachymyrmex septentrionalis]|uniref:Uncharacterized protein n=1 Tax=Trachymyrmex septentrionalis TaxID=34720 RepID=A0A151JX94_9HYME|nr:hypothetical protein ALC56_05846 [Trachymyrmex septentrionalis]
MSRRSARAGRELALVVFPLSITDTGGVSRYESEPNGRPNGRARYLKTSGAAGAIRLVRDARIVNVCGVRVRIRALVCSLALLASSTTTTTARTRTTATRGAKHSRPGDEREPLGGQIRTGVP